MAENDLPESARRPDSTPVSANVRGGERGSPTEAPNGENRAPCSVCKETGGRHIAGCSALAGDLTFRFREPNEPAPPGPRQCGTFIGARGRCVLASNHTGDHEPEQPPIRTEGMPLSKLQPCLVCHTEGMPLSKLQPCLVCHGFLGQYFHVVDLRLGVINRKDDLVRITDDPRIDDRVFLCTQCFAGTDLPMLMEKIHQCMPPL